MSDELLTVQPQCVASIGSAVKANDPVGLFCEKIGDFTFAFVTVLKANNYGVFHGSVLIRAAPHCREFRPPERVQGAP